MPRRTPGTTSGTSAGTTAGTTFDRLRTPRGLFGFLKAAAVCTLIAGLLSPLSPISPATEAHAAAPNDYCGAQCSDILPPGQSGNATLAQILLNQAFGVQPEHAENQLGPYANMATGHSGVTTATINNAGTSPSRWPRCIGSPAACTAMISACTALDTTVNQISDILAAGLRAASIRKTPSVAYTPTIIMK